MRNEHDIQDTPNRPSIRARGMALAICSAILFGGSFPELGNIWAETSKVVMPHRYNIYFLVLGIIGIAVSCIALYRRYVVHTAVQMVSISRQSNLPLSRVLGAKDK